MNTDPKTKKVTQQARFEEGEYDGGTDSRKSEGSRVREGLLYDQKFKCAGLRYPGGSYRRCNERPSYLDHIIELRHGGLNEYDNYQMLCHGCHAKKTAWNSKEQCSF
jgi:5-methylcytosine-specific restriction endonuclease McrA